MKTQQHLNIHQLKKALGTALEKDVQRSVIEYLKRKKYKWGRINVQGTYDEKNKCRRKNPYLFEGLPDFLVVKKIESMFNVRYRGYAVECKREKGGKQSAKQKEFQRYWEGMGQVYILARGVKDLEEAGL